MSADLVMSNLDFVPYLIGAAAMLGFMLLVVALLGFFDGFDNMDDADQIRHGYYRFWYRLGDKLFMIRQVKKRVKEIQNNTFTDIPFDGDISIFFKPPTDDIEDDTDL